MPGEHLSGVYSAKDFVGWYNGLPSCREVRRCPSHRNPRSIIGLEIPPWSSGFAAFTAGSGSELRHRGGSGTRQRGSGRGQNPPVSPRHSEGERHLRRGNVLLEFSIYSPNENNRCALTLMQAFWVIWWHLSRTFYRGVPHGSNLGPFFSY